MSGEPLPPGSPEVRIGVAWRELRRGAAMPGMRDRLYADLLDPAQVDALDVVVQAPGSRMSELADVLRIDASTMTRAVDRLVRAGLAERVAAQTDGRGVAVQPTALGLDLHGQLTARRREMLLIVLAELDGADRAALADLLERFVAGIDRYVRPAGD